MLVFLVIIFVEKEIDFFLHQKRKKECQKSVRHKMKGKRTVDRLRKQWIDQTKGEMRERGFRWKDAWEEDTWQDETK